MEGRVGADLALGVAGVSQLPFVDGGLPSAGLLAMGAPRGDARLMLADGDLPYAGGRELPSPTAFPRSVNLRLGPSPQVLPMESEQACPPPLEHPLQMV